MCLYTGVVTTKEKLHGLVEQLDDEHASRALLVLEELVGTVPAPRRSRPAFIGSGCSQHGDLSTRVDELLAEGFGRDGSSGA